MENHLKDGYKIEKYVETIKKEADGKFHLRSVDFVFEMASKDTFSVSMCFFIDQDFQVGSMPPFIIGENTNKVVFNEANDTCRKIMSYMTRSDVIEECKYLRDEDKQCLNMRRIPHVIFTCDPSVEVLELEITGIKGYIG